MLTLTKKTTLSSLAIVNNYFFEQLALPVIAKKIFEI